MAARATIIPGASDSMVMVVGAVVDCWWLARAMAVAGGGPLTSGSNSFRTTLGGRLYIFSGKVQYENHYVLGLTYNRSMRRVRVSGILLVIDEAWLTNDRYCS